MPARPLNSLVALAFTVGGGLFALGAAIAQVGSGDAATSASIYLAGGAFFSTGGYGSVLQAVNFPPGAAAESGGGWRWWRYEPTRPGWLAAFVLFVGLSLCAGGTFGRQHLGIGGRRKRSVFAPVRERCASQAPE